MLNAASKLLTDRGYTDITIHGITVKAKVGKMTIYRWWPTKVSIYMELYSELAKNRKVTPPPDTGNVVNDLIALGRGTFKLYRETAADLALAAIVTEA